MRIDYRVGEAAHAPVADEHFNLVLLLAVCEHVDDVAELVRTAAQHVAPGGLLVASTIDRTLKSFVFAIVCAEYLFRVQLRSAHRWSRFGRPAELQAAASRSELAMVDLRGMRYLTVLDRADWVRSTSVNYIATFSRPL